MELSLKGLIPRIQNDNSIIFTDKNGENKFVMPAPFMTDSAEGYSEDIEIELEENNGTYLLKMTPDKYYPVKRLLEEGTATNQYKSFVAEMNRIMDSAEYFAIVSESVEFTSIRENYVELENSDGWNWYLSLGKYRYWVKCRVHKSTFGAYSATIYLNIRDYYDWDPNKKYKGISDILNVAQEMLYNMNYVGMARNFNTSGSSVINLKWNKGERVNLGAELTIIK